MLMPDELEKEKMKIAIMKTRGELIKFNLLLLLSILLCSTPILMYLFHKSACSSCCAVPYMAKLH